MIGSISDASGRRISGAAVRLTNTDENIDHEATTNSYGTFEFPNTPHGNYTLVVTAPGFRTFKLNDLILAARQTLRADASLQLGEIAQSINVESGESGVIPTDSAVIQETFGLREILDLPANVRAGGSTSPYSIVQLLPGVQSDSSADFSISGGIPSQTQWSLDGISITDTTGNQPLANAFPSSESIAEIKVQGVGNPAEYGQMGDITTVSRNGTNELHGAGFWYAQNSALNATNFGATFKPRLVANDFGVTGGGPVYLPGFYNGKNRTFFYGSFEGFRYPRSSTLQDTVPTQAMVNGNFNAEGNAIVDPAAGSPFPQDAIPASRINPLARKFLSLFPAPNTGDSSVTHAANYVVNRDAGYQSNQYDVRIDQRLTSKQIIFGRWTSKDINFASPNDLLIPSSNNPDNYRILVLAHNYSITSSLVNELRFGFTHNDRGVSNPFNGAAFSQSLGMQGLTGLPAFFNGLPEVDIAGLTGLTADRLQSITHSRTLQAVDNLTWVKGLHTIKAGFDFRRIEAITPLGFLGGDNYGGFSFTGEFTGAPFADFLLGLPATSSFDNVQKDNDGLTNHYNAYAQDSFRVARNLPLEYGLRWEFHPGYADASGNIGNFDPSYAKSGAVIYPDGYAGLLAPGFLESANACPGPSLNGAPCMPVLSASQAGLPESLRTAANRILPRFGFAYRPVGNRTTVRGGFNIYNTEVLGSIYYALTGTLQSATYTFNNTIVNGVPLIQWPSVKSGGSGVTAPDPGTDYFGTANQIHYKDPYSEQWNLSLDRDLGFNTGMRISYIGMVTRDLVWAPDLNQSYYSTTPYLDQPLSSRPFPNWGVVNTRANGANANYNAGQIEINHRYRGGLSFNSAYTFARAFADDQGYAADHFADENAGHRTMDALDRRAEYGPVYGTRKHRWITSATYDLPVGRSHSWQRVLGGWQVSTVFLLQSGPYLTPYFTGGDPSGTGSGIAGRAQAPDLIGNPILGNPTATQWFNTAAYTCPGVTGWAPGQPCLIGTSGNGNPIGRFGNAGMGRVIGPATVNLNAGLSKTFTMGEHFHFRVEGSFTNVLNHVNLSDPILAIDTPGVGSITSARPSDFGGARTGQVGARLLF